MTLGALISSMVIRTLNSSRNIAIVNNSIVNNLSNKSEIEFISKKIKNRGKNYKLKKYKLNKVSQA